MMRCKVMIVRKYRLIFFLGFTVLLIFGVLINRNINQSKYLVNSISYSVKTNKIQKSIRLVQITDLHNSIFGENNQDLIDLVAEQLPDLILITGDLLNSDESETDIATNLISGLGSIAPVYVSLGNHENIYRRNAAKTRNQVCCNVCLRFIGIQQIASYQD